MSLDFGKKLAACRKVKNLSQKELAKLLNTSHSVIGKYEREEMTPSIEAAVKLAKLLDTTVGYLLGENKDAELLKDPAMLKRLQDIDSLPDDDKNGILYALDNLLKAAKLKAI
ncbi:transcriptional regulator [Flavivirga aquatica]|uniref:Transcriptional regulator n=1 Tax=Flavivirga aquatica TaxID=1849968 RepID=A0A1E5T9K7_9FLAO|nr:helix-turn-helix transcriptional regulator [Flavivirga aquatica]OEK08054.1 transcriptional regulator [Flavivirga aquatica]